MGLSDFFERKDGTSIGSKYQVWTLTQSGKQRLDRISGQTPAGKVMDALYEEGTATIAELARNTGMNTGTVRAQLLKLQQQGYVQAMN